MELKRDRKLHGKLDDDFEISLDGYGLLPNQIKTRLGCAKATAEADVAHIPVRPTSASPGPSPCSRLIPVSCRRMSPRPTTASCWTAANWLFSRSAPFLLLRLLEEAG